MQHYRELQSTLLRLEEARQELQVCMQLPFNLQSTDPMCVGRLCRPHCHSIKYYRNADTFPANFQQSSQIHAVTGQA